MSVDESTNMLPPAKIAKFSVGTRHVEIVQRQHDHLNPLHLEALASFHVVWGALFADKLEEQIANQAAGLTIFQTFCVKVALADAALQHERVNVCCIAVAVR